MILLLLPNLIGRVGDYCYRLHGCGHGTVAVRVGYQMLWVDNVALALNQVQNSVAALPAPIDAGSTLFAYGFYGGVTATW